MMSSTAISVGLRVVRGPDWKWGDQDGNEGYAGTIVEIGGLVKNGETKDTHPPSPRGTVILQWDTGIRTNCRVGHQNAYNLRLLDSSPTAIKHPNIACKTCSEIGRASYKLKQRSSSCKDESSHSDIPKEANDSDSSNASLFISGIRWSCSVCSVTSQNSYDLCTACYMADKHDVTHQFWRIETTNKNEQITTLHSSSGFHASVPGAMLMPARNESRKVTLRGLFTNCKVVRGQDWNWKDQDGGMGKIGKILEIHGWNNESEKSVASVRWPCSSITNVYRVGHKGKVDIKVAPGHTAAACGTYYPDHLPVLGKPNPISDAVLRGDLAIDPNENSFNQGVEEFNVGNTVKIDVGVEHLSCLQEGHGGFNPRMGSVIGKVGKVHRVTGNGDVRVQYKVQSEVCENPANYRWTINPLALKKLNVDKVLDQYDTPQTLIVGQSVRIIEDEDLIQALQTGHGEWIPTMKEALGRLGRIIKVYSDGDVRVTMVGEHGGVPWPNTWTFNPACLEIQHSEVPGVTEEDSIPGPTTTDKNNSCGSSFRALVEVQVDPIVAEAVHGCLDKLTIWLDNAAQETEIDKNLFRACLQAASQHGRTEIVRIILEKLPAEVDVKYQGKTALQVAAHQGHLEIVR